MIIGLARGRETINGNVPPEDAPGLLLAALRSATVSDSSFQRERCWTGPSWRLHDNAYRTRTPILTLRSPRPVDRLSEC